MFLGGDQYRNDLSNNLIIKCHECGDTNLRYVDSSRTGDPEKPYICGNGHTTWGALDDWSIKGQTDSLLNSVNDCCCEGTSCDFPKSIKVNFDGLIGVQAREPGLFQFEGNTETKIYGDNLSYDLLSRIPMPYFMCPPCFSINYPDVNNGPWSFNCGNIKAEGSCYASDDQAFFSTSNPICPNCITESYTDEFGRCTGSLNQNVVISSRVPGGCPEGSSPDPNFSCSYQLYANPNYIQTCVPISYSNCGSGGGSSPGGPPVDTSCPPWAPQEYDSGVNSFFAPGYPKNYGFPTFLENVSPAVCLNCEQWQNIQIPVRPGINGGGGQLDLNGAGSVFFATSTSTKQEIFRDAFGSICGQCTWVWVKHHILYRIHPTADGNALSQWFITQDGINEVFKNMKFVYKTGNCTGNCSDDADGYVEPPTITPDVSWFCNTDNQQFRCADCTDSPVVSINNEELSPRSIWPWRVPAFRSAGYGPTYNQLIRNENNLFDGNNRIGPSECGCRDAPEAFLKKLESFPCPTEENPVEGEEPITGTCTELTKPECEKYIVYPKCLEKGNLKCSDVDSKYRIECSNPSDYFTVALVQASDLVINNRKTFNLNINPETTCGLHQISVVFHPNWIDRVGPFATKNEYERFVFPAHPACPPPIPGIVEKYGFNGFGIPPPDFGKIDYAGGIKGASLHQLVQDIGRSVDQPHCLRRVKNPNFDNAPYYAVNTADISNQTLVLDRYYPTGSSYDYAWSGVILSEDNKSDQAYISNFGDVGVTDYLNGRSFPFPFTAHSGSLEEPEIVAIIHSEKGEGGQIAFQTFPVSYESDELVDIKYDALKPTKGTCLYKHRVTAHGYGVMYPLIDDPLWNNDYDNYLTYPVILPGVDYEIGDKIEFRCWKCLEDADERGATPGENESVWKEECVETIIATATITELNDERVSPSEIEQDERLGIISVEVVPLVEERYLETYKVNSIEIVSTGTGGLSVGDRLTIEFTDESLGGVQYSEYPEVGILEVDEDGNVLDYEMIKNGEFWKVIRTGGIRWYEFDEEDSNGDPLISIGNCPCEYDICANPDYSNPIDFYPESECVGCISKNCYPSGHNKIDAIPAGFPDFPNLGCISEKIEENEEIILRTQYCDYEPITQCSQSCQFTYHCSYQCSIDNGVVNCGLQPNWFIYQDDDCNVDNCSCAYPNNLPSADDPVDPLDTFPSNCQCGTISREFMNPNSPTIGYVGPFSVGDFDPCYPINNTWEFYQNNYALSACSGNPYISGSRPYLDGITVIPPQRPQYKYVWLPKLNCLKQETESQDLPIDTLLNIQGCNPLNLDKHNRSYKFPTSDFVSSDRPCRKWNDNDSLPENHQRNLDDYCRVYGFYQQRQPSCEVIYKGQYILRAAQKNKFITAGTDLNGTDCEPLIEDITIRLTKKEAKVDISVGAPYNQDYIIPENLPIPYLGSDGKLEVCADSWNDPSLIGNNNTRFFEHGMYEPNRKAYTTQKNIPGESEDQNDLIPVVQINPDFKMYDVDGNDYYPDTQGDPVDIYISGVWDLPDPRTNARPGSSGLQIGDECVNPTYENSYVPLPPTGLRNSFLADCPYPWENYCANSIVGGEECDFYCMFKNNSAEIVLDTIKECDYCSSTEIVKYDKFDYAIIGRQPAMPESFFHYTYKLPVSYGLFNNPDDLNKEYVRSSFVLFRCYGSSEGSFDLQEIESLIKNYIQIWIDRTNVDENISEGKKLLFSLSNDTERRVFCNFIFQGANNNKLDNLTKIELYLYDVSFPSEFDDNTPGWIKNYRDDIIQRSSGWPKLIINQFSKIYEEQRCEYPKKGGSIESLLVTNGGSGYAFEIEERVPPSGILQVIDGGTLEVLTTPKTLDRRRETYAVSGVNIDHNGVGYEQDQIISIKFNDQDYRREKIYVETEPTIRITGVDTDGKITGWQIENSGEFYKYVGTNEHRAFPVSVVLNNYWNHPYKEGRSIGKNALLKPVIGVDPEDKNTYGKIKRVEVEYGGIDYVIPEIYWTIDTKTGRYNPNGDLYSGLDIQHLVDPCKYQINGSGISSSGVTEYYKWTDTSIPGYLKGGTEYLSDYEEIIFPDLISPPEDPFKHNKKYYYHTGADIDGKPIRWEDRVKDWSTVIFSGTCPFGPGGLLDRTYEMALVEEIDMTSQRKTYRPYIPTIGNCSDDYCDQLIDAEECTILDTESLRPDEESYADCNPNLGCNVFTVYDAHRFPISHINYQVVENAGLGSSWYAKPRPYIQGCSRQHPIDNTNVEGYTLNHLYCNGPNTNGYVDLKVASNPSDKCADCEYSLYAEFGKFPGSDRVVGLVRGKSITYKMKDPITMKISFNDEEYETLSCPSDEEGQEICDC